MEPDRRSFKASVGVAGGRLGFRHHWWTEKEKVEEKVIGSVKAATQKGKQIVKEFEENEISEIYLDSSSVFKKFEMIFFWLEAIRLSVP